jgi:hypothetical protein
MIVGRSYRPPNYLGDYSLAALAELQKPVVRYDVSHCYLQVRSTASSRTAAACASANRSPPAVVRMNSVKNLDDGRARLPALDERHHNSGFERDHDLPLVVVR